MRGTIRSRAYRTRHTLEFRNMNQIVLQGVSKKYRVAGHAGGKHSSVRELVGQAFGLSKGAGVRDRTIWALKDVTFDVAPGETIGIIGANGSGKSTLLKLLAGTLEPDGGHLKVS